MTSFKFRVVRCRIRPFPTFISENEMAWFWTTLQLDSFYLWVGWYPNWFCIKTLFSCCKSSIAACLLLDSFIFWVRFGSTIGSSIPSKSKSQPSSCKRLVWGSASDWSIPTKISFDSDSGLLEELKMFNENHNLSWEKYVDDSTKENPLWISSQAYFNSRSNALLVDQK